MRGLHTHYLVLPFFLYAILLVTHVCVPFALSFFFPPASLSGFKG